LSPDGFIYAAVGTTKGDGRKNYYMLQALLSASLSAKLDKIKNSGKVF
jgi:hypothetical protein